MSVWLLRIKNISQLEELESDFNGWRCAHGFVIIAQDEETARQMAAECDQPSPWWNAPEATTCEKIAEVGIGPQRIVMGDWPTG